MILYAHNELDQQHHDGNGDDESAVPENCMCATFFIKKCKKICVCQKKVVLLHREMNEGTRKGSLARVKLWIKINCKTGFRSI